jgi:hypothetical protein
MFRGSVRVSAWPLLYVPPTILRQHDNFLFVFQIQSSSVTLTPPRKLIRHVFLQCPSPGRGARSDDEDGRCTMHPLRHIWGRERVMRRPSRGPLTGITTFEILSDCTNFSSSTSASRRRLKRLCVVCVRYAVSRHFLFYFLFFFLDFHDARTVGPQTAATTSSPILGSRAERQIKYMQWLRQLS